MAQVQRRCNCAQGNERMYERKDSADTDDGNRFSNPDDDAVACRIVVAEGQFISINCSPTQKGRRTASKRKATPHI
ncbi:hypothetical protein M514_02920 [Trichuris suis]|nr:hypothetical protein M514_02920 [Trichuris suis]